MRNAVLAITLLVALGGATGTGICAEEPAPPPAPGADVRTAPVMPAPCIVPATRVLHPRMVDMLAARLSLTEDQQKKIADLLTRAEEDMAPVIEAQQAAARDFVIAFGNPDTSQADLVAAAEKAMKAELAIMTERIKTLYSLRALLTPEQNKSFSELLEQYTSPWRAQGAQPRVVPPRPTPPPGEDSGEGRR